ncbi:hypothetical protein BO221_04825 [Archangium sp. Cb G35]|uniref:hypothetical protein n=1 Tax=Archangium sp. Cb G35 TaxID=1920190 RepID=UPI000937518D|nr:hypothetical protein [Archangium sp. Cb G35]OJT27311.1 hypothetical protein BO221_04825 [Archangium sp. Cb G35]
MGETARERSERLKREAAGGVLERHVAQAVMLSTPKAGLTLEQVQHARRKAALAERLAGLGVPVVVEELPDADAELGELEQFAATEEQKAIFAK